MFALLVFLLGPAWLGGIFSIWAGLVMISRVALGVHYFSDIFFGLALGILFGCLTYGLAVSIPEQFLAYPGVFLLLSG
jgi:membrane-associated phospholipid phosphatase